MDSEENKAVARRFVKASVASDLDPMEALLAPGFVAHEADGPQDREAFLQHLRGFLVPFSDIHFEAEEQVAEGDKVVTRATWSATHTGDFQGLPATGNEVSIGAILIERVQDGKIVEHRGLFDTLSLMQQLGAVPAPEQAR
jgi:steroid delta-isomerase-like uncharacterized protein